MKKYRIKEEAKKYFNSSIVNDERTLYDWINNLIIDPEALEEVPQRIELKINPSEFEISSNSIIKIGGNFTDQEKELCEKALNGELFSVEELDRIYENEFDIVNQDEMIGIEDFIYFLKKRK